MPAASIVVRTVPAEAYVVTHNSVIFLTNQLNSSLFNQHYVTGGTAQLPILVYSFFIGSQQRVTLCGFPALSTNDFLTLIWLLAC